MTTDLLNHIGLLEEGIDFAALWKYIWVFFFFVVLVQYILFYHLVSFSSGILSPVFPQTAVRVKRAAAIGFWDLCIYFLVSSYHGIVTVFVLFPIYPFGY